MTIIAVILICFIAHVIRDGYPSLGAGMTFFARLLGALLCVGAGYLAGQLWGAALGSCIGIGFWTDWHHADGQQARNWKDAGWLAVSGISSLALFAIGSVVVHRAPVFALVGLAGLAKPPIWFLCWKYVPQGHVFQPTRVAAGVFGAVVGAALWGVI